jgi:hypothetical protein
VISPARLVAATLLFSLVACTGGQPPTASPVVSTSPPTLIASSTPAPTLPPTPTPTTPPTTSPSPTQRPDTTAPAELAGRWKGTKADGETVYLTLIGNQYTIERTRVGFGQVTGRIDVVGDEITFGGSEVCDTPGTYGWTVVGDTLELASQGDPCTGRIPALAGIEYKRTTP